MTTCPFLTYTHNQNRCPDDLRRISITYSNPFTGAFSPTQELPHSWRPFERLAMIGRASLRMSRNSWRVATIAKWSAFQGAVQRFSHTNRLQFCLAL